MPNRHVNTPGYRFGFNGMEMDDEVDGEGNSYTAEFWQYDSRLGRRWNVDPVVKPWESGYTSFNGNPIIFKDPDGKDGTITTTVDTETNTTTITISTTIRVQNNVSSSQLSALRKDIVKLNNFTGNTIYNDQNYNVKFNINIEYFDAVAQQAINDNKTPLKQLNQGENYLEISKTPRAHVEGGYPILTKYDKQKDMGDVILLAFNKISKLV